MMSNKDDLGKADNTRQAQERKENSSGTSVTNKDESRQRREALGRSLRRVYQDVVQEGVPDDFAELMKKLDEISESDL